MRVYNWKKHNKIKEQEFEILLREGMSAISPESYGSDLSFEGLFRDALPRYRESPQIEYDVSRGAGAEEDP